ncbi:hypothetical protein [Kitasatospora purpeofusca]|uniref:hypothetical protein n=1 Tax=Kitasatospora purpeofusca TaxID=67352 RepID=UPI003660F8B4
MRVRKTTYATAAMAAAVACMTLAPAAHADGNTVSTDVYKFYPGGGMYTNRTGEIDFTVTTTKNSGGLVDVRGTLSGHNNVQGNALGIKMDFTQPYVVLGDSGRFEIRGQVVLQSCIAKKLPVCGPSATVTFTSVVNFTGPQSPATARSSNTKVFPVYTTP